MPLSEGKIEEIVGAASFYRGAAYARDGRVLDLSITGESETWSLRASVEGSAPLPYAVTITARPSQRGQRIATRCTCPLREACKHVAAVLLSAQKGSKKSHSRHSSWERSFSSLLHQPSSQWENTALGVEFVPVETRDSYDVVLRVRRESAPGKWVRSGVSWGDFTRHNAAKESTQQQRLLHEIAKLCNGQSGYYSPLRSKVSLGSVESGGIWPLLHKAHSEGVPFFLGRGAEADDASVQLSLAEASVRIDITLGPAKSWVLSPRIECMEHVLSRGAVTSLGSPAHGVAVWDTEKGFLFLAPLSDPGQHRVLEVFARASQIEIPRSERAKFLEKYFPLIERYSQCISTDSSVQIPRYSPPILDVALSRTQHKTSLQWSWVYSLGGVERRVAPTNTKDPARDREAEQEVLHTLHKVLGDVPGVFEESASTLQLRHHPSVWHRDTDSYVVLHEAVEQMRSMESVRITEVGEKQLLRRAEQNPSVSLREDRHTSDWLDLAVAVSVEGEEVPFKELFTAVATQQEYMILPSGVYFPLDTPELQQLRDLIEESRSVAGSPEEGVMRLSRFHVSHFEELEKLGVISGQGSEWVNTVRLLAHSGELPQPELPTSFAATLRPYQMQGYAWLSFLYRNRLGGVLADDMGLGKTLQTLAMITRARSDSPEDPPFLVVAPTSVVGNWSAELRRFAPGLRVAVLTETAKKRGASLQESVSNVDVVITSYTLFRLEETQYAEQSWSALILDEAQWVKNHQSKGYQGVRKLGAPVTFALTGTPMENNLMELWAMFSLAAPGLFPHPKHFSEYYRVPIEKKSDVHRLDQLRRRVKPFLLRRRKEEVASELPEKVENTLQLELLPQHKQVYRTYLQRERQKVLGLLDDVQTNRFEIFRSLTLLRQASLDPSLIDDEYVEAPSTKLDAFEELVREIAAEGHRVLVFSQFTRFLQRTAQRCSDMGLSYCYLDGSTRNRPEVIREFKEGDAPVFLISLKAGGVGLNLTEADYCIVMDPWWNPAAENQAIDRTHRIGQTRSVMVYRMIAQGTIEEKVAALSQKKAEMFRSVLSDTSEALSSSFTVEEIRSLLE